MTAPKNQQPNIMTSNNWQLASIQTCHMFSAGCADMVPGMLQSCPPAQCTACACLHSKSSAAPDHYVFACVLLLHRYGSLLEVDETLKKLRMSGPKAGEAMLVEEVGPEEIAGVVSKWTGTHSSSSSWSTSFSTHNCGCLLHITITKLWCDVSIKLQQ